MDRPGAGGRAAAVSGIRTRIGVFCLREDIISSIFMSCLGIAARVPRSMRRMSTLPPACWNRGFRRPRRPACWPGGWAARPGRRAATSAGPPRRARSRFPSRARCSPSGCRAGWRRRSGSMPARRAGRSRRSSRRRWRNFSPGSPEPSAQVNGGQVEAVFVFDRHAATDLSVAYGILVPQRRARTGRAGQEGQADDERGDLRPGLQQAAGEGPHDRVPARRAARPARPPA